MPLDAVCLSAVRQELEDTLIGARADKIFMPGREEVHIAMRAPKGNVRLLLSSGGGHARAHLTETAAENPPSPPMFCMLLRKHLTGARLTAVEQPPLERVLCFHFDATDEMGHPCRKTLICELMGRHSNLILQGPDGRVIDCLKRVDIEMSERRQVLPGLFYRWPPGQDKKDPLQTTEDGWRTMIEAAPPDTVWDDWLLKCFSGISPLVCRELAARAADSTKESFLEQVLEWRTLVLSGKWEPWWLFEDDRPADFCYMPVVQYGDRYKTVRAESFSQLLDAFFTQRDRHGQLKARAQDMNRLLVRLRDRATRKLAIQEQELAETKRRERLRECGDLLMAHLSVVPVGAASVTLTEFSGESQREIRLNPALSPQQNAAKYYKDYRRAKTAEASLVVQMANGREELAYLDSVLDALSRIQNTRDLLDIRQELVQGGYLRDNTRAKRTMKGSESEPWRFVSSTGTDFSAGRNNRQNDMLTFKMSSKGDIWLHTRNIPGSHVIIYTSGGDPDDTTLHEAAQVAATLSQAAGSSKVPVDYTRVAYVKKPPGAKPGMVTYDKYKTLIVEPDKNRVEQLRGQK